MTKNERLDSLEANLSMMAKCMEQLLEQQKKQQIEQQQQIEAEPQEQPINELVEIISNKINSLMNREKIDRDKVVEIIQSENFKKIDTTRIGKDCWGVIFVNPTTGNIIKFIIDLELNNVKGYVLYK